MVPLGDNQTAAVRCHVVAVTSDLSRVLVIRTTAGWLLPCVESDVLPGVLTPIQEMLNGLTSTSIIVHAAPLTLGPSFRRESYCVALVSGTPRSTAVEALTPSLLRTTHPLLPIQQAALATSLERLQQPRAPFDSERDVSAALTWAEQQITERLGAGLLSISRHRCDRHQYVVRFETTAGSMYFKGGPERVADEAIATELLRRSRPRQFPETVAIDHANHRWLYRALEGEPLDGPELTIERATEVARSLASLQKDVIHDAALQEHLHGRRMNAVKLFRRADSIVEKAWSSSTSQDGAQAAEFRRWNRNADRMFSVCTALDSLQVPLTLVLSDFWRRNILRTFDGIGFIDVGDSYWSCPILPLWRFINDVEKWFESRELLRESIEHAYVSAWADLVTPADMYASLARLPLLGALFTILLVADGLNLEERALGTSASPDYRAARLTPHLRDVRKALPAIPN